MRPLAAVPCVLVLACLFPAASPADDFSDYRIPDHTLRNWSLSLQGGYQHPSTIFETVSQRRSFWDLESQGAAQWTRDSEDRRCWIIGSAQALGNWARNHSEDYRLLDPGPPLFTNLQVQNAHDARAFESVNLDAGTRWYPGSRDLAWSLHGFFFGQYQQQWSSNQNHTEQLFNGDLLQGDVGGDRQDWTYVETTALEVAFGRGRVRDATPVFGAQLLEERLTRDHVLTRPLSPAGRQRLADLFALQGDFAAVHLLPGKFFWREIERVLREDGAIDHGLDAYAVLHATEPLVVASSFVRETGWFGGPKVSLRHEHQIRRSMEHQEGHFFQNGVEVSSFGSQFSSRDRTFSDRVLYGGQIEYHRPLGTRLQFDAAEEALFAFRGDPQDLVIDGSARLARLVGERWFLAATIQHDRELDHHQVQRASWYWSAGGSVGWFVEDWIRLQLDVTQQQAGRNVAFGSFQFREIDKNPSVRLQVTTGRGLLLAPGTLPPVHSL